MFVRFISCSSVFVGLVVGTHGAYAHAHARTLDSFGDRTRVRSEHAEEFRHLQSNAGGVPATLTHCAYTYQHILDHSCMYTNTCMLIHGLIF